MSEKVQVREKALLRIPLTIRWTDSEHKQLVDTAWQQRVSASEFIRRIVRQSVISKQEVQK